MDIVDEANELAEKEIKSLIENRKKMVRLDITGECHNCGHNQDNLFCDDDCRDDYERVQKIKEITKV